MCLLTLSLSGCSFDTSSGLGWLDQKIGSIINETAEEKKQSVMDFIENGGSKIEEADIVDQDETLKADNLTTKQKEQIDEWLDRKGFNRYGDDKSAIYTGGTPLFNEQTGAVMDRYDYILNKFPDILERIEEK